MKLSKKIVATLSAAIMSITALVPFSASATPLNTSATAETIQLNQNVQTFFDCGYIDGTYDTYVGYRDEKFFKFTAPETRYYEINVTGYENDVYAVGYSADLNVSVRDSYGESVGSVYTNPTTGITRKALQLKKGETYYLDLYDMTLNDMASYKNYDYGYASHTITMTVTNHTHTMYESYKSSYSTYYECRFCDYSYSKENVCKHTHKQKAVTKQPTYWSEGSYNLYCTDCGKTIKTKVKIAKKAVNLKSVKAGKKQATVKWSKVSDAKSYQIKYSTSSKMKSSKTVTVKGAKNVSKTIKKLKKGKKYYFKVRAVKGKKTSSWSKIKSVKVK